MTDHPKVKAHQQPSTPSQVHASLHDWFAGQALASCDLDYRFLDEPGAVAEACYARADAMIAERKKRNG